MRRKDEESRDQTLLQFQGMKYCDGNESCIGLFYLVGTLRYVVLISLVLVLIFSYCTERGWCLIQYIVFRWWIYDSNRSVGLGRVWSGYCEVPGAIKNIKSVFLFFDCSLKKNQNFFISANWLAFLIFISFNLMY